MSAMRLCRSCTGPVPRASRRCPWCQASFDQMLGKPEHLFSTFEGQGVLTRRTLPPPEVGVQREER